MRAYAVEKFGEAPAILDLPIPADEGAYLIRVKFAGVNPIDYKLVDRLTAESKFPFVLGADFSGVVERVPAGKSEYRVGERILGMARQHGAYAEYTAVAPGVKTDPIARIPGRRQRRTGGGVADSVDHGACVTGNVGRGPRAVGGGDGSDGRRGRICGADGAFDGQRM